MIERDPDDNRLLHALDLALVRDWGDSKALTESIDSPIADRLFLLLSDIEEVEAARGRKLAKVRHEIGNALSIVQANIEGMVDGILEPTVDRLNALLSALATASLMLDDLRRPHEPDASDVVQLETFNICALIEAHVAAVRGLANAKDVSLDYRPCGNAHIECTMHRGDGARTGRILRNVLLTAVRYTPPHGAVEVRCDKDKGALVLRIRDHHIHAGVPLLNRLLKAIGGKARLEEHDGAGANELIINLPVEPVPA